MSDTLSRIKSLDARPDVASDEERFFLAWCEEAVADGWLSGFLYQPPSHVLSKKATFECRAKTKKFKMVERHLMHPHRYQADFLIFVDPYFDDLDHGLRIPRLTDNGVAYEIDTKGDWMNRGSKQEFSMNQKWLYQRHGIYVNKVVPHKFFERTWAPREAMFGKRGKQRKKFSKCRLLEEVQVGRK